MFKTDSRYFRYFDWITFALIIVLSLIGLAFVFSATYRAEHTFSIFFKKQLFGVISGIVIYILCCMVHYKSFMRWGYFFYFAIMAMLIFTIVKGSIGMGGQRWINLGIIKLQPSEIAKFFFPAFATYYLYTQNNAIVSLRHFIPLLLILAISCLLILKQPDLGTALLLLCSGLLMLWLAGINKQFFRYGLLLVVISAPVTWHVLKPYQKKRILVFIGQGESKKERYQIEQSEIAIGSGGLTGKGFLHGTQNKLLFLPESRTDFIFSVICEELGFIGSFAVLLLLTILFIRLFYIILTMHSPVMQLLAFGLVIHIMISAIINIGMVTGLLPVVGIPLPLISYGLSNLWTNFASLGLFANMAIRRFYIGE